MRDGQDAAEAAGFAARGFLVCMASACAAARAALWRLMRVFFAAWPLRCLIFSEQRRSLLPIANDSSVEKLAPICPRSGLRASLVNDERALSASAERSVEREIAAAY